MAMQIHLCCCFLFILTHGVNSTMKSQLLLVSFDGFRYDYLNKYTTPTFKKLAENGVHATSGYFPTFPSSTFPCHYTLVTGLHSESHGIVSNRMYDPQFNEIFTLANTDTRWFDGGEPIWITAKLNGLKSACFFWPGSETKILNNTATFNKPYNKSIPFEERIKGVVHWLAEDDVSFATLYFEQPDSVGHEFGPFSTNVRLMVEKMDQTLQYLLDKLNEAKLLDRLDLIITSDHGMAEVTYDDEHILYLDNVLNTDEYYLIPQIGCVTHILPKEKVNMTVFEKLQNANSNITVYFKEDIPQRFHYSNHRRIMPIVLIADEGYLTLANKTQLSKFGPGQHGYDNHLPSMRPIFIASGPSFVQGAIAQPFESVHLYPLMCHLLGIEPRPNNGSLEMVRWMLKESNNKASHLTADVLFILTAIIVIKAVYK